MLKKKYNKSGSKCTVTFMISAEQASGVASAHLVGDFNNWNKESLPLVQNKDKSFEISIELEPGHEFLFRYLLDQNRWENDWNADKYAPSPFADTDNSIVIV